MPKRIEIAAALQIRFGFDTGDDETVTLLNRHPVYGEKYETRN